MPCLSSSPLCLSCVALLPVRGLHVLICESRCFTCERTCNGQTTKVGCRRRRFDRRDRRRRLLLALPPLPPLPPLPSCRADEDDDEDDNIECPVTSLSLLSLLSSSSVSTVGVAIAMSASATTVFPRPIPSARTAPRHSSGERGSEGRGAAPLRKSAPGPPPPAPHIAPPPPTIPPPPLPIPLWAGTDRTIDSIPSSHRRAVN